MGNIAPKKPLMTRQFIWIVSRKEGNYRPIIGPALLGTTDDDIFVIPDPEDPLKVKPVESANEAIQDFITLKPDEYAVIHNPCESYTDEYPNGKYSSGENGMETLKYGSKRVVIKGHFPIWPEQKVDICKVPRIASDQYLLVEVEDVNVDKEAPFYDLTVECSKIQRAMADDTVESKDTEKVKKVVDLVADTTSDAAGGGKDKSKKDESKKELPIFSPHQRIMIPGSMTATYIIPSGIKMIGRGKERVEIYDESRKADLGAIIDLVVIDNRTQYSEIETLLGRAKLLNWYNDLVDKYKRYKSSFPSKADAWEKAFKDTFHANSLIMLSKIAEKMEPLKKTESEADEIIYKAPVLGPTKFCVIIQKTGEPNTFMGSGRVFPGPYDVFRTEGSDNRVYNAYHINQDRGILIRVIANKNKITKEELLKKLPMGAENKLEKDIYGKGDEIFIDDFDAYIAPTSYFEIVDPITRKPHIGNDHSNVYVHAIGVDQKSGVHVREIATGNVKTERGTKHLLLDPRKKVHVKRQIPITLWNLVMERSEPHKIIPPDLKVLSSWELSEDKKRVIIPWAWSVSVPNNEAMLVVSKDGRRPVEGPCMDLLEYEEVPEILQLSRGRGVPKSNKDRLETCFLRVSGNQVTDVVTLETLDSFEIEVFLRYNVRFVVPEGLKDGDEIKKAKVKWFDYKDYIMLLCARTRSLLRNAALKIPLPELDRIVDDFIRDTILGRKPVSSADKKDKSSEKLHRPGLFFSENNMIITEVDILNRKIKDADIGEILGMSKQKITTQMIETKALERTLEYEKNKAELEGKIKQYIMAEEQRKREISLNKAKEENAVAVGKIEFQQLLNLQVEKNKSIISQAQMELLEKETMAEVQRNENKTKSEIALTAEKREKLIQFRTALTELEKAIIKTNSDADVDALKAVQPNLIKAIEGLGDKTLLAELAGNIPKATGTLGFLGEAGGLRALRVLVKGTRFENIIQALSTTPEEVENSMK